MASKALILIIDDERPIRVTFQLFLENEGYEVVTAADYEQANLVLGEVTPDAIITDIVLGNKSGVDLLRDVKLAGIESPVVLITGEPNLHTAIDGLRLGAFDYLTKPVDKQKLVEVTFRALRYQQLLKERKQLSEERESMRKRMQAVFDSVGEGLLLLDEELRVREINRAGLKLLRISREETLGRRLSVLFPRIYEQIQTDIPTVLQRRHAFVEATVTDPCQRGGEDVVYVRLSPTQQDGAHGDKAVVVIRDITRLRHLEQHVVERTQFHHLIGRSKPMQEVYQLLEALKDTDTTVLIQGESGTGKELVAAALHYQGPRSTGPFIPVNCTALNEQLLESELFGHVKGAFTGAIASKMGRFEAAENGTIFLDEIGDISPKLQTKLLRALQERTIERVGENRPRKVNVRVIAATNSDMDAKVRDGLFREDLFYRLNVVRIMMPALREKKEDIPLLIENFRQKQLARMKKPIEGFTDEAMQSMILHQWPGNVRELENAVEHAFIMSNGPLIDIMHLPKSVINRPAGKTSGISTLRDLSEQEELRQALISAGGNRAKAARLLGINRTTLYRRMQRWGMSDSSQ